MACPYFWPIERRCGYGERETMMPLGGGWGGVCEAIPGESWRPDEIRLHMLCNFGYARGACERFPADARADAVRFTIVEDNGIRLRLYYTVERDHHPHVHGPLEYVLGPGLFADATPGDETLLRQARAYVESYLKCRAEA